MIIPITIGVALVLSLGLVFFVMKKRQKRKEELQRRLSEIEALKEGCRQMQTIGNLSSGYYEEKIQPIYDRINELTAYFTRPNHKFTDADYDIFYSYQGILQEIQAQQPSPQ